MNALETIPRHRGKEESLNLQDLVARRPGQEVVGMAQRVVEAGLLTTREDFSKPFHLLA